MINNEDFRKVDRTDKVQELTDIWHRDIVATRRWLIAEVYGEQVAKRYSPMMKSASFSWRTVGCRIPRTSVGARRATRR